jgi:hypothetical protein
MKVINSAFMTTRGGCIGVVAENEIGQRAYICVVPGDDEESDIEQVKNWGSSLSIQRANGFFPGQIDEERYGKN